MKKRLMPARISEDFHREVREIVAARRSDVDKPFPREIASWRVLDGIIREPEWPFIKERLKRRPRSQ
jgi:hypothetical protein